jgi:hypothetical protein
MYRVQTFQDASGNQPIRSWLTVSWTAPAECNGDGAFARTERAQTISNRCPHESGVALRFPPQSKMLRKVGPALH